MKTSEQINELASALAKAQSEMEDAELDKVNPHFKNRYSSFKAVSNASKAALAKHGLSMVQMPFSENGVHRLETRLLHSSGQWISGVLDLLIDKPTMQGLGSAISYGKRQSKSSILGIVDEEDDDGNAASKPQKQAPPPKSPGNAFNDARNKLHSLVDRLKLTNEMVRGIIKERYRKEKSTDLLITELEDLIMYLERYNDINPSKPG